MMVVAEGNLFVRLCSVQEWLLWRPGAAAAAHASFGSSKDGLLKTTVAGGTNRGSEAAREFFCRVMPPETQLQSGQAADCLREIGCPDPVPKSPNPSTDNPNSLTDSSELLGHS